MRTKPLAIFLALGALPALAHVNEGMDYTRYRDHRGAPCCDHTDCRPADDFVDATEREPARLLIDGHWIDVPRTTVVAERSPDGRAHWCGGRYFTNSHLGWAPLPRCVILPPRQSESAGQSATFF
ncbi:MAG: hypothetical protein QOF14_3624 [Hyphomicrobiales bacterium]|nr:hypothetical protein [Hyphomicrobiales bacterium]